MDEIWSLIRAIVFENILRLLVHSQKTRYLPKRASCLQTQTHHLFIHDYIAYLWHVCQCLIVGLLLGFIEHLLRFVLSIKLYKSFFHELFPHFLCLRHQVRLDDITHVAKSVRSVRCGLCGVKWGSMNLTVKHLNYFYNRIILVILYQNDVKVPLCQPCTWTCTLTYIFVEHH